MVVIRVKKLGPNLGVGLRGHKRYRESFLGFTEPMVMTRPQTIRAAALRSKAEMEPRNSCICSATHKNVL